MGGCSFGVLIVLNKLIKEWHGNNVPEASGSNRFCEGSTFLTKVMAFVVPIVF